MPDVCVPFQGFAVAGCLAQLPDVSMSGMPWTHALHCTAALDSTFPCTLVFCSALQVGTMVQEHREEVGRLHEYIQVSTPVKAAVPSAQSAARAAAARVAVRNPCTLLPITKMAMSTAGL